MPTYLITGCRAGIGLEYVRQLSRAESNTVIAAVRNLKGDLSALEEVKNAGVGAVHIVECDISNATSIESLPQQVAQKLGPNFQIDILINNAAALLGRGETSLDLSADALLSQINTNVLAPARVLQALLPHLASGATVANISSGAGSIGLIADGSIGAVNTTYCISKAALNMLMTHQAKNLPDKIIVSIDPGHVKTEMGGPDAAIETHVSANGVLGVLKGLKKEDSGKFFHYQGGVVPW